MAKSSNSSATRAFLIAPLLIVSAGLITLFQNCGAPNQEVLAVDQASTAFAAPDSKLIDESIVVPSADADVDSPIGSCSIALSGRGHQLTLSGITRNACAQACSDNARSFYGTALSCTFGGTSIASVPTRQRSLCRVSSDAKTYFAGATSAADCNSTCQFAIDTSAKPASVSCAYEDKVLFHGPLQTNGKSLGPCSIVITGPVFGSITIANASAASCTQYCASLNTRFASMKSNSTCTSTPSTPTFRLTPTPAPTPTPGPSPTPGASPTPSPTP